MPRRKITKREKIDFLKKYESYSMSFYPHDLDAFSDDEVQRLYINLRLSLWRKGIKADIKDINKAPESPSHDEEAVSRLTFHGLCAPAPADLDDTFPLRVEHACASGIERPKAHKHEEDIDITVTEYLSKLNELHAAIALANSKLSFEETQRLYTACNKLMSLLKNILHHKGQQQIEDIQKQLDSL